MSREREAYIEKGAMRRTTCCLLLGTNSTAGRRGTGNDICPSGVTGIPGGGRIPAAASATLGCARCITVGRAGAPGGPLYLISRHEAKIYKRNKITCQE